MTIVPFGDLYKQYLSIKSDIDQAIAGVIESSAFIRGSDVTDFEQAFATAVDRSHCVSCANGTDALYIAMYALGAGPGDEVIVPAMSWISTSETVSQTGAKVVFCDIDSNSLTMDPTKLEAQITPRTVGIIPVHLYGHPADMVAIMEVAVRHGLWVIEDCAQAHLAQVGQRQVGTFGSAATYSFYPGKNLGAMGDAGAIVTNNRDISEIMAKFSRHGGLKKGDHEIEGINSRMDGLQAAILNVKLPHLQRWTQIRRALADQYATRLNSIEGLKLPREIGESRHVWHLYVVQSEQRDDLRSYLSNVGIETSINYPRALPFLPCYADRGNLPEHFPNAYALAQNGLALPLYPEMTAFQLDTVVKAVTEFFETL